jgi:putative ABC transport system permease protein
MALVVLLLLATCANIANLSLARWTAHQREFAIRLSLGAGRSQLVRQLLVESLALSLAGGVLALLFANWASTSIAAAASAREILPARVALNGRVLLFCAIVSVTTSLAFGVIPALRVTSARAMRSLRAAGTGVHAASAMRPLVAAQVALSVVLVGTAALFGRSLVNLWNLDPGYDRTQTVQIRIDPLAGGVREGELAAVYQRTIARARAVPGVLAAAVSRHGLASGVRSIGSISLEGYEPAPGENVRFMANWVGPAYFSTTGMRLLQGRPFTDRDVEGQPGVAIVNEVSANRYFGGVSQALGRRLDVGMEFDFEIVGVIADARVNGLHESPAPMAFYPLAQAGGFAGVLEVRVAGDPTQIGETVRRVINAEEPRLLANSRAVTIAEQLDRGVATDRLLASLAGAFGLSALLLACVGLYGVLTYSVGRRTSEIGVRMALGASPASVIRLVVNEGLRVAVIGIILGVAAAIAAGRMIESLLFGVSTSDPLTYAGVVATLLSVATIASLLPARRAARVNPLEALKAE